MNMAEHSNSPQKVPSPDTTVHEPVVTDVDSVYVKPEHQIYQCVEDELRIESPTEPINKRARPRPDYMRHVKSPFSYVEMISFVIESNTGNMLTLRDIISLMSKTFPCLAGDYIGWKNSVRHTLSINECFKKVLRRPDRPFGKDNFWVMNIDCKHCKMSRTAKDLKIRYQQYIQQADGTEFPKQPARQRFSVNNQRTPEPAVSPVGRLYKVMYPQIPMPISYPSFMPIRHPIDLSLASSRKRPSMDNEPLDLSVKKFKSSPPSTSVTQNDFRRISPASSPDGSSSPENYSYSPELQRTNSRMYSPELCLFRSELHFPPGADRTEFLNRMEGRMYEYGDDGRLKIVREIADPQRPIYVLSSIPRPHQPVAEEY